MSTTFFFYLAFFLYLAATCFYLVQLVVKRKIVERMSYYSLPLAFLIHLFSILLRYLEAGYTPITNFHESLSFFSLAIAGFFLYLRRTYRIATVGAIILPAICIMLVWAVALPGDIKPLPPVLRSYWLPIHTLFCFVGNAIFFVSFFVSVLYLVVERAIKRKRFLSLSANFPSLETLDLINYRCISYGFPFLTMGIITGSIWAGFAWGSYWSWDPKETWSLITWIVYAILLHNRLAIGWRGRRTAYLMILGFFSILLTFFGVNLFIGGLHSYL
jgi:cytochrome c-type biogenesis protein CcsB